MTDERVMEDFSGRTVGRHLRVFFEHVDPHDAHTDTGVAMILGNHLLYRPGTLQAWRSGGRKHCDELPLVLVAVKVILQWLQRAGE